MAEYDPGSLRAAALRGTLWSAVQQIGNKGLLLPLYLVLARLLPVESFGLVALAAAYIDFVMLFLHQGLTAAIVQREDLEREHLDSAFWGNIGFALLLAGFGVASAETFARLAGRPELASIVRWLSIAFLLSGLISVQDAILRRGLRFKALAIRAVVGQATAGTIGIVLAFSGYGVWSLVAMQLINQALGCVLLWRASDWRPRMRFSFRRYLELLAFGVNILGLNLIRFARVRADNFLIGFALGTIPLGYYTIARQLTNGLSVLVTGSIAPVLWSTLPRLQRQPERMARAIYQGAEMLALMTWPAYFGLAAVAALMVPLFLGDEWLPSIPILVAFSLAAATHSITGLNFSALLAIGETGWRVRIEILSTVVSLLAMIVALPGGIVAVAWAYAGALYLLLPVQVGLAVRLLPIELRPYLRRYRIPAGGSVLMLAAVLIARPWAVAGLAAPAALATLILLGAFVFAGFVWLTAPDLARRAAGNLRLALSRGGEDDTREIESLTS